MKRKLFCEAVPLMFLSVAADSEVGSSLKPDSHRSLVHADCHRHTPWLQCLEYTSYLSSICRALPGDWVKAQKWWICVLESKNEGWVYSNWCNSCLHLIYQSKTVPLSVHLTPNMTIILHLAFSCLRELSYFGLFCNFWISELSSVYYV